MTMIDCHARYFNEITAIMGGHFPKVHYLGSRAFDKFLYEVKQRVVESGNNFHGNDDTFHFLGIRIIRTGEP